MGGLAESLLVYLICMSLAYASVIGTALPVWLVWTFVSRVVCPKVIHSPTPSESCESRRENEIVRRPGDLTAGNPVPRRAWSRP